MATTPIEFGWIAMRINRMTLAQWFKRDGDVVVAGEALVEIDVKPDDPQMSCTFSLDSPCSGRLRIQVGEGDEVFSNAPLGVIETLDP